MQPTTRDEREVQAREMLRALRSRSRSQEYSWGGDMSVETGLLLEGSRFEFVQAMRLLTRIARQLSSSQTSGPDESQSVRLNAVEEPALPMVENAPEDALISEESGASSHQPAMDNPEPRFSIRLRSRIGLDFSPASVHSIRLSTETEAGIEVIANLLAIGGQNAPLPEPYTEMLLERQRIRDMAMTDFFDIFHHRLLELYFTTTLHSAPWLQWQHPATNDLAQLLYSVAGLGPADLRDRMVVPDRVWLRYAGLLWHRPHPAVGFERIAADHFKLPVRLGEAVGRWLHMEPEDQSRLNRETCRLGRTATLGTRVWLREAGLLLHLGPMDEKTFQSFLPQGSAYRQLQEMAKFYFEDAITLDLELELHAKDAQAAKLGGARLGWTSWIRPVTGNAPLKLRVRHAGTS